MELLVVLAIIALLGSIAVPTAFKVIGSPRTDVDKTTATLHKLLQSARLHAMSHHVNAAVVLRRNLEETYPDRLRAYGIVAWDPETEDYVPVGGTLDGGFQIMPEGIYVPLDLTAGMQELTPKTPVQFQPEFDHNDVNARHRAQFTRRPLAEQTFDLAIQEGALVPSARTPVAQLKLDAMTPLYAFVFEPSGALVISGAFPPKERYQFLVRGISEVVDGNATETARLDSEAQKATIEVYRSTGRVKVASE